MPRPIRASLDPGGDPDAPQLAVPFVDEGPLGLHEDGVGAGVVGGVLGQADECIFESVPLG